MTPAPIITDPNAVVMFGGDTFWRYAEANALGPGVFRIRPFIREPAWQRFLLNGADAHFMTLRDVPEALEDDGRSWFFRRVEDSKELTGTVTSTSEFIA